MSFLRDIVTDAKPREMQYGDFPFRESSNPSMELQERLDSSLTSLEHGHEIEMDRPGKSDFTTKQAIVPEQPSVDRQGEHDAVAMSPVIDGSTLSETRERPQEDEDTEIVERTDTFRESFIFEQRKFPVPEYSVETITEPVGIDVSVPIEQQPVYEKGFADNFDSAADRPDREMVNDRPGQDIKPLPSVPAPKTGLHSKRVNVEQKEDASQSALGGEKSERTTLSDVVDIQLDRFGPNAHQESLIDSSNDKSTDSDDVIPVNRKVTAVLRNPVDLPQPATPTNDSIPVATGLKTSRQIELSNHTRSEVSSSPQVHIGRIDIVVEAPITETVSPPTNNIDRSDFASRHYLRRL
jgi:hypothetical protein